jgi:cytosine/adenosine deaminase-related metal-dependent hydrolase
MRLNNLRFLNEDGLRDGLHDLWVLDGKIAAIRPSEPALEPSLDLNGALAFPGLINSHDHLDFNLFPPMRNHIYNNYREWGPDIHTNNRASIDPILSIPQKLRTQWGIYKNLVNGFTTVRRF